MAMAELMTEHQRLVILRLLWEAGQALNESILCDGVNRCAVPISRDQTRTQLAWLAEQGLITLEQVMGTRVASLTGRGEDVATGRARVPGIKRPRAGD
ncbi:hypothetical protein AN401_11660 [Zobellella denitrificans]|uniref:ArsR family transcriptional regulator n=1 Tax=Zobellella denitrificans TaxID=347534 RepID=A0A291HQP0_9GAMM|nr:hypothetical protein [Zobellella denitrificans]ATG74429.1 hypothetical protein AN401_11660 [Zobellella denitrificans]